MKKDKKVSDTGEIRKILRSGDENSRREAVRDLLDKAGLGALDDLVEVIEDPSRAVRETVVEALAKLPPKPVCRALLPKLYSERSEVRNIAMEALSRFASRALEVFIEAIDQTGGDPDVEMFLVEILGETRDPKAIPTILSRIERPHPNLRNAAVVALGKIGSRESVSVLKRACRDEDWICFSAIDSLSRISGPEAENALINMLERDRGDMFDITCLEGLSKSRNLELVPSLLRIMMLRREKVKIRFIEALRMILDGRRFRGGGKAWESTRRALHEAAIGENSWTAYQAVEVLELLGEESSTPLFIRLSGSDYPEIVRCAAIRALGVMGEAVEAEKRLEELKRESELSRALGPVLHDAWEQLLERKKGSH